jgi:predicted glycosyltransferase
MIKRLNARGFEIVVIALDHTAQQILQRESIAMESPEKFRYQVTGTDEEAMDLVRGLQNDPSFLETVSYNGISFWEMVELETWGFFSETMKDVRLVQSILDVEKPALSVILDNKTIIGAACKFFGERRGIKTKSIVSIGDIVRFLPVIRRQKRASSNPILPDRKIQERKILVPTDLFRDINDIKPWILEMKNDNEILVTGIDRDWEKNYREMGINYRFIWDYIDMKTEIKINHGIKSLPARWNRLKKLAKIKESSGYCGLSLWEFLEPRFAYIVLFRFAELIEYAETFTRLIEVEKPDIIVTTGDRNDFVKMICSIGRKMGITTLIVQHGVVEDHPVYGPIYTDKMAVTGEAMKNVLMKRGVMPEQLVITGQPRYDELFMRTFNKEKLFRELGISTDNKIIVLTTQPVSHEENESLISAVTAAMKEFPQAQLVIKLHPDENLKWYQHAINSLNYKVIIVKDLDLFELLNACDVMMTLYSTTALEAMIMDKPVITINLMNIPDRMPYAESGAALGVYSAEDIAPAIKKAMYDEEIKKKLETGRKKFVYEQAYLIDGKASRRVADLIEAMAG